jgi:hypothetical protein
MGRSQNMADEPTQNGEYAAGEMAVSWGPDGVPLVTTVEYESASSGSIVVHDKADSLRLMWAEIERLRAVLSDRSQG